MATRNEDLMRLSRVPAQQWRYTIVLPREFLYHNSGTRSATEENAHLDRIRTMRQNEDMSRMFNCFSDIMWRRVRIGQQTDDLMQRQIWEAMLLVYLPGLIASLQSSEVYNRRRQIFHHLAFDPQNWEIATFDDPRTRETAVEFTLHMREIVMRDVQDYARGRYTSEVFMNPSGIDDVINRGVFDETVWNTRIVGVDPGALRDLTSINIVNRAAAGAGEPLDDHVIAQVVGMLAAGAHPRNAAYKTPEKKPEEHAGPRRFVVKKQEVGDTSPTAPKRRLILNKKK